MIVHKIIYCSCVVFLFYDSLIFDSCCTFHRYQKSDGRASGNIFNNIIITEISTSHFVETRKQHHSLYHYRLEGGE